MRRRWHAAAAAVALTLLIGCGGDDAPAARTDGGMAVDIPALPQGTDIESVMAGLVDEAAHGLWGLEAAGMAPPESEVDWAAVERYAIQLIASGSYIGYGHPGETDPNWVERTGWRQYSQDLTDAGVRALDAAIRRDQDGVAAAGEGLVRACEGCHQEYGLALNPDRGT